MSLAKTAVVVVVGAEAAVSGALGLLAWLYSSWMMDDSVAVGMDLMDWLFEGAKRLAVVTLSSGVLWGILNLVNRHATARWLPERERGGRKLALFLALIPLTAGAIGAVRLVIERPFM